MTRIVETRREGIQGAKNLIRGSGQGPFRFFPLEILPFFFSIKCILGFGSLFQPVENVVESRAAKHTSEDTQDSGVQFIMPAGPRGISSQQGP